MNIYNNILSTFIGITVLEIEPSGKVKNIVLDTRNCLHKKKPKTVFDIFSKEEKFRVKRVLELGGVQRKRYVELDKKYSKGEFVDIAVDWSGSKLYMYIQFFESNRDKEVAFDRYIENLASLSERDPLTNVLNRNGFWQKTKQLLLLSDPDKRIGIIYLDVDRLKEINDKHGHDVGDITILEISQTILTSLRDRDIVTRVGGDEFVIVVEELSGKRSTAYGLAKRLLKDIAEKKGISSTTISAGVHVTKVKTFSPYFTKEPQLKKEWDKAIKQADNALYVSKKAGGNRVSVSPEYSKYY